MAGRAKVQHGEATGKVTTTTRRSAVWPHARRACFQVPSCSHASPCDGGRARPRRAARRPPRKAGAGGSCRYLQLQAAGVRKPRLAGTKKGCARKRPERETKAERERSSSSPLAVLLSFLPKRREGGLKG